MTSSPKIPPLKVGRISIRDQAQRAGVPVPVGLTVDQLRDRGFDVDPEWPGHGRLLEDPDSPTSFAIRWPVTMGEINIYALAT